MTFYLKNTRDISFLIKTLGQSVRMLLVENKYEFVQDVWQKVWSPTVWSNKNFGPTHYVFLFKFLSAAALLIHFRVILNFALRRLEKLSFVEHLCLGSGQHSYYLQQLLLQALRRFSLVFSLVLGLKLGLPLFWPSSAIFVGCFQRSSGFIVMKDCSPNFVHHFPNLFSCLLIFYYCFL